MRPVFRLLPLPLCIALSLTAHADDDRPLDWSLCPVQDAVPVFADAPVSTGNPEERDLQNTDLACDSTEGVMGGTVMCRGNVTLQRGDQFLHADSLSFDAENNTYTADGNVRYQDSGMRMVAESAHGNQNADTHQINDVRYQLIERRGNGGADSIRMEGTQGALMGSTYSTCPPNDRHWELRADQIDIDTDSGFGTARNATIRVGKVPVLYVPWFKFPIDDRRVTGLLYPNISQSNRNGFDWRQPIYINLAPNYDMTLEPRLMTKRGLMLNTEFRYLTPTGRGEFDFGYLPSDDLTSRDRDEELAEFIEEGYPLENRRKDNRGRFSFLGRQNINRTWQARANLNWISDPRYLEDFNNNVDSLSNYRVNSDLGVYGRGRHWDAGLMADYYQLADYTLSELRLPYYRLPRAYFNWEQSLGQWFTAGVHTEAARFQHIDGEARPGGTRLDLKPYVSMPLGGASWFVTPTLAWRYTGYRLDDELAENLNPGDPETSPSRSTPISSLDAGLYFDRNIRFRGEDYVNTLEPRLFYLNVPYRNQDNLPIFDTGPMTFSWGQLFRDNRFSGADRQADANQLTLAVTSRLIRESDGREKLAVSLGQIQYFDDSRVGLSSSTPVLESGRSAWVADTTYAVNDRWSIGASYQWDPKFGREDLASLRTRYLIGDDGIVNFSYRYRRDARNGEDLLEQADLSFLYPVSPSWSLVGRYYYSIQDKQMLEGIAGVQWDSCCLAARLVARRYVRNRTGEMNDAIQLEIELKGLGSAGPDTESRLRRAILGYYREDLYLVPPPEVRSGDDDDSPYDSP
ncbi:LPS assembly protein LptD [Luteimonas soli]|uniref:LPS-assembly protein LptD n=1 Tax=Luteimonas soli TaxID=1648966 RepID=A0ABV7XFP5_9GAMM